MDLSTVIAGVSFPCGVMNASGALCVTPEELEALGRSHAGAIVTKSMTPRAREGNPHPRYVAFDGGSINSMGLPNLGFPAYAKLIPELKRFDYLILVQGFDDTFDTNDLKSRLSSVPKVQYVQSFLVDDLKSRENLIF